MPGVTEYRQVVEDLVRRILEDPRRYLVNHRCRGTFRVTSKVLLGKLRRRSGGAATWILTHVLTEYFRIVRKTVRKSTSATTIYVLQFHTGR